MDEQFRNVSVELYKEVLGRGEDLEIKVGGSSMWPFIKDGETLVIRKVSLDNISRGDVVAVYVDQKLTCHRVFKKSKEFIQTKADALIGLDARVSYEDVLGRVVAQKRNNHVHICEGWVALLMGQCILLFSFVWAPIIPVLRRCKATLIR